MIVAFGDKLSDFRSTAIKLVDIASKFMVRFFLASPKPEIGNLKLAIFFNY